MNIDSKLDSLSKSKFRSSFHLNQKMIDYVKEKGMKTIVNHAYDIVNKNIKPLKISNDGRQTPMKNHPVFIAQHATATCCRNCLYKWHHIEKNKQLTSNEVNYIVTIIIHWIRREIKNNKLKIEIGL